MQPDHLRVFFAFFAFFAFCFVCRVESPSSSASASSIASALRSFTRLVVDDLFAVASSVPSSLAKSPSCRRRRPHFLQVKFVSFAFFAVFFIIALFPFAECIPPFISAPPPAAAAAYSCLAVLLCLQHGRNLTVEFLLGASSSLSFSEGCGLRSAFPFADCSMGRRGRGSRGCCRAVKLLPHTRHNRREQHGHLAPNLLRRDLSRPINL